jgi:dCMP deaminase
MDRALLETLRPRGILVGGPGSSRGLRHRWTGRPRGPGDSYNGLPRGVSASDPKRFDRASGEKFFWGEHAERNAIFNATRSGIALEGCTLYVNRFPCSDCARAIIQTGIVHVICPPIPEADGAFDYSFQVARQMLTEAGVKISHP